MITCMKRIKKKVRAGRQEGGRSLYNNLLAVKAYAIPLYPMTCRRLFQIIIFFFAVGRP